MKNYLFALALILMAINASATFTVSPSNFSSDTSISSSMKTTFTLINSGNTSATYSILASGQLAPYAHIFNNLFIETSNFAVPASSQTTFILQFAQPPTTTTPTTLYGGLVITENSNSSVQTIGGQLVSSKWVYFNTNTYATNNQEIDVKFGGANIYIIRIRNAAKPVVFDVLTGTGAPIITGVTLDVGDTPFEVSDMRILPTNFYGGQTVKLEIDTTNTDSTIVVTDSTSSSNGVLDFVKTKISREIKQGDVASIPLTIINQYKSKVEIRDLSFDGDALFKVQGDLQNLEAGEQMGFVLTADASDAKTGLYSGSINVVGYLPSGTKVTNSLPVQFTVTAGVSPTQNLTNLAVPTFTVSKNNVAVNEQVTVSITNIYQNEIGALTIDDISADGGYSVATSPIINPTTNTYVVGVKFPKAGRHLLVAKLIRTGVNVMPPDPAQILVGLANVALKVRVEPDLRSGIPSNIIIFDDLNNTVQGAQITVNGVTWTSESLTPSGNNTAYSICASLPPYTSTAPCPTFYLENKTLNIVIDPIFPIENDPFTIKIFDSKDGTPVQALLFIDNVQISSDFKLVAGTHTITAKAQAYTDSSVKIKVFQAAKTIKVDGAFQMNSLQTITLDQESPLIILYQENDQATPVVVATQDGSTTHAYTPPKAGTYIFRTGSSEVKKTITGDSWLDGDIGFIPKWMVAIVVGAILAIILLVFFAKLARRGGGGSGRTTNTGLQNGAGRI